MAWTDEAVEDLKRLWAQGLSAGAIAKQFGGITRNSVIGKVRRLGLPYRESYGTRSSHGRRRTGQYAEPATRNLAALASHLDHAVLADGRPDPFAINRAVRKVAIPKKDGLPLPMPAADDKARISFNALEQHHCRWPAGETTGVGLDTPIFCGLDKMPGSSYCPGHQARASVALPPRRPPSVAVPPPLPAVRKELEAA